MALTGANGAGLTFWDSVGASAPEFTFPDEADLPACAAALRGDGSVNIYNRELSGRRASDRHIDCVVRKVVAPHCASGVVTTWLPSRGGYASLMAALLQNPWKRITLPCRSVNTMAKST